MHIESTPSHLDRLVSCLVQWAGMGAVIIEHMPRSAEPPSGPAVRDALFSVLRGALDPLTDRYTASDLDAATTVLADAIATAAEQLLLVDLD